jgi:sarcosine oxidase delta subunit
LQFPPGHVLSSKTIYDEAGDNEELDYEIVDVTYTHSKVAGANTEHWMHFKVARTDLRISKRGKVEKKEKKSKMAAKLEAKAAQAKGGGAAGMKVE